MTPTSVVSRDRIHAAAVAVDGRFVRASVVLVRKALKDKVYSVALLASQTLSLLLSDFFSKHKVTKKEMTSTLEKVLPDLLAKTSDNATRTQNLATTAVLEVLSLSLERGLGGVGVEVTRPLTNTVHPRGALCRANIVETQLNTLGPTALPKDKESGFTPRHVVEFGHSAFKHQNNEVRKVGERLLLALYPHFPSTVRKALPLQDDLARKNVLYRNLFEQLEALDEKVRRDSKHCFRSESKLYVESRINYTPHHPRINFPPSPKTANNSQPSLCLDPPAVGRQTGVRGVERPRRPRQSHRQPMPSKVRESPSSPPPLSV
ncbi:hypothetical protein C7M84_011424 [Penaeus vannamei]|uniref:Uncharacterized protein n=1 Tax=Penaeus vannamei TaxID=6689 RepID=A0A3R7M8Y2_PENVA|nr:hypothetical protein C7M84_011424 [Penaeus vannamei]